MANCKTLYLSSFYRPPNSSTEILDHLGDSINQMLLSNNPNSISGVSTYSGLSDHDIVDFEINLKATRFSKSSHRVYLDKKANFNQWPKRIYSKVID